MKSSCAAGKLGCICCAPSASRWGRAGLSAQGCAVPLESCAARELPFSRPPPTVPVQNAAEPQSYTLEAQISQLANWVAQVLLGTSKVPKLSPPEHGDMEPGRVDPLPPRAGTNQVLKPTTIKENTKISRAPRDSGGLLVITKWCSAGQKSWQRTSRQPAGRRRGWHPPKASDQACSGQRTSSPARQQRAATQCAETSVPVIESGLMTRGIPPSNSTASEFEIPAQRTK
jgi:hypothetical protein